tara:strand:+ start:4535 stop:6388 length:1854 start_codon:yes stop_codon:yes gene_type:complete
MKKQLRKMIIYDQAEVDTQTLLINSIKKVKGLFILYIKNLLFNNNSNINIFFSSSNEEINEGSIINKLHYEDIVCYESKMVLGLNIDPSKPVKIYEQELYNNNNNKLYFSVFLGISIEKIRLLTIKGHITVVSSSERIIKHPFYHEIDHNYIHKIRKPSFWIDVEVDIPKSENIKKNLIKLYIEDITINRTSEDKTKNFYISKIRSNTQKLATPRLILVVSLDGVTNEDINIRNIDGSSICPTIKQLQSNSISFNNAYCSSTVTASSAASLLTGLGLSRHFMYDYNKTILDPDLRVLSPGLSNVSELVKRKGYDCFGMTSYSKWKPHYGYSRGFDHYKNFSTGKYHNYPYLKGTIEFISNCTIKPSFVLSHLPLPHPPLVNRLSSIDQDARKASYYHTLSEADLVVKSIIGLIKELGIFDSSMIFLVADHGRSLPPYTRFNYQFNEERLRVPFMVKLPEDNNCSFKWNDQINDPISATTSIFEMILDLTNIDKPSYFHELSKRKYGEITWVSETVDYEIEPVKTFGIVGYDSEYKWVLYFDFNNVNNEIGKLVKIITNPLNNKGYADDSTNIINSLDKSRIDSAISEANEYICRGKEFAKENSTIFLDEASISKKIL